MKLLLLPGMHGTARLFAPFVAALPPELEPILCAYPTDVVLGYDALQAYVPVPSEPCVVLAESFSGPLAVRAARAHANVVGVVLAASFVAAPRAFPRWILAALGSAPFRFAPPAAALRFLMLEGETGSDTGAALREAIREVAPEVLAHRAREIASVDAWQSLRALDTPLLYVAGARDRLVPKSVGEAIVGTQPERQLVELDAPHLVLQARPREAAEQVAAFVRGPITVE